MRNRSVSNRAVGSVFAAHGLFVVLALLLASCGPAPFASIREGLDSRGRYIEGVPFVGQKEFDCGPAALAGVFAFRGRTVDIDSIAARITIPKLRGTLPMDMERYASDAGFRTSSSRGTVPSLQESIRRGDPVICLLDLGFGPFRQPHYVTVIGFDEEHRLFIMHDGITPNRTMAYEQFERYWARAGQWMLVVEP
jgi:ABC-type bacteriocin/lantibiotic exporter with double-glycine peptidase domain